MLLKILIVVLYLIPMIAILVKRIVDLIDDHIDLNFGEECLVFLALMFPLVSLVIWILIANDRYEITKKFKIQITRKKELRERKKRIKLGIVRINETDPFGEETWESLK